LELQTYIAAPIERVFDLARSVDAHLASTGPSLEQVVQGRKKGLLEMGEEITWEGIHFGIRQCLCVKMVELQRPNFFRDTMLKGAFSRFTHAHYFHFENGITVMKDAIDYEVPFGIVGRTFDGLILSNYLRRFIGNRNQYLKEVAESDQWKRFGES
jgi:ligand-binding SRPBCC domain-containing protein